MCVCVCVLYLREPRSLSQTLGHVLEHDRLKLLVSEIAPHTQDQRLTKPTCVCVYVCVCAYNILLKHM